MIVGLVVAIWISILSLGNHPTALFAIPGLLIYAVAVKPMAFLTKSTWAHVIGASLSTVLLYIYIYLRSIWHPIYNEGAGDGNIVQFLIYLTGARFHSDFVFSGGVDTSKSWLTFLQIGSDSLSWPILVIALLGIAASVARSKLKALPVILVPAGILLASFLFHDIEAESWFALAYVCLGILAGSMMAAIMETFSSLCGKGLKKSGARSVIPLFSEIGVASLLVAVIWSNVAINQVILDYSKPSPDYARAKRALRAVETPAVIIAPEYNAAEQLLFCLVTDPSRKVDWNVIKTNDFKAPITVLIAVNRDQAIEPFKKGYHVYIYAESAPLEADKFTLLPVDTGIGRRELYELEAK